MYPELSEQERFPLLTPQGRRWLHSLRQDAHAPRWNWPNGEQLNAAGLERVQQFAARLQQAAAHDAEDPPPWLAQFVAFCLEEVPFYRRRSPPGTPLAEIPSCSREDLAAAVWDFVPDSQPLDELITFSSSGTSGFPVRTPTHPFAAACGIPLIEAALAGTGVSLPRGVERMALSNIAAYPGAYTTAIVVAYLEEAGCIRVNLSPELWRKPQDCPQYLDRYWAPVMLGDPQALAGLGQIGIERPPQVIVSSIVEMNDALAAQLTARYGCPVIDLYALTEAGIVAVKTPGGHRLLPHDLHVEILDEHDRPLPPGVRGEVTLTGGRNPFLPLLRYRTGDYAALGWRDGTAMLFNLEGRRPVMFPVAGGIVHSMEITRLVRRFPIVQYQLRQDADGGFAFRYRGSVDEADLQAALFELLRRPAKLRIDQLADPALGRRKHIVYVSDHPDASRLSLPT